MADDATAVSPDPVDGAEAVDVRRGKLGRPGPGTTGGLCIPISKNRSKYDESIQGTFPVVLISPDAPSFSFGRTEPKVDSGESAAWYIRLSMLLAKAESRRIVPRRSRDSSSSDLDPVILIRKHTCHM